MDIEKKIMVGPTDTDSYNIIHHPQYIIWMEEAILEWLLSTYGNMEKLSYEISKVQCKFISPGVLYDNLLLQLRLKNRTVAHDDENMKFQVKIVNQKDKGSVLAADLFLTVKGK